MLVRNILSALLLTACANVAFSASQKPNIVFILADDLGYGDLGCYGQEKFRTPNIDKLAADGMRFTQHYSGSPVCAPARCVLMTGKHPGHAIVRNNKEAKPEGQFPLTAETVTLAEHLKKQGYTTGIFGKWGLGGPDSDSEPLEQGFDRFFGYNCQRDAHNFYPQWLYDNEKKIALNNPLIKSPSPFPKDADPNTSAPYQKFQGREYSADLIAEQARAFVKDNKDKPFFVYWPTTVPHLALQVPEDSLAEYVGKWPDPPYTGGAGYVPHFTPRAAYAAMITRMDNEVGRMLELLKELKLDENTIIVFTSDNGPTHGPTGGSDPEFFNSSAGLRGVKGSVYEGGIRVPLLVRWKGKIAPGSESNYVSGFEDWIPTLLEIAREKINSKELDGLSIASTLLGKKQPEREFLYREFTGYGGQQSMRMGDWKLVRRNLIAEDKKTKGEPATMELFNIAEDPNETKNVASEKPELVEKLLAKAREQHVPSPDFPFPALDDETTTGTKK